MTPTEPFDDLPADEWSRLVRRAVAMTDAPAPWVQSAVALWSQHEVVAPAPAAGTANSPPARLRRWLAELRFDSGALPLLAAQMRALPGSVRHLLFTAAGRDIDLRIAPLAEGYSLSGQLLGPDGEGHIALAGLVAGSEPVVQHEAKLDDLGAFRLDGVPGGRYQLTVHLSSDEIVLPPIDVGAVAGGGET